MRRLRRPLSILFLAAAALLGACGPRIATRPRLHPTLESHIQQRSRRPMSSSSLEREEVQADVALADEDADADARLPESEPVR